MSKQSAGWWTSPSYTYTELFSGARRPGSAHAHALGARTGSADLGIREVDKEAAIGNATRRVLCWILEGIPE